MRVGLCTAVPATTTTLLTTPAPFFFESLYRLLRVAHALPCTFCFMRSLSLPYVLDHRSICGVTPAQCTSPSVTPSPSSLFPHVLLARGGYEANAFRYCAAEGPGWVHDRAGHLLTDDCAQSHLSCPSVRERCASVPRPAAEFPLPPLPFFRSPRTASSVSVPARGASAAQPECLARSLPDHRLASPRVRVGERARGWCALPCAVAAGRPAFPAGAPTEAAEGASMSTSGEDVENTNTRALAQAQRRFGVLCVSLFFLFRVFSLSLSLFTRFFSSSVPSPFTYDFADSWHRPAITRLCFLSPPSVQRYSVTAL